MKSGQKVKFIGVGCKEQISWGGNVDPAGILEQGKDYTVKSQEIHSWHTKLFLEEAEGQFNPLWFESVETNVMKESASINSELARPCYACTNNRCKSSEKPCDRCKENCTSESTKEGYGNYFNPILVLK